MLFLLRTWKKLIIFIVYRDLGNFTVEAGISEFGKNVGFKSETEVPIKHDLFNEINKDADIVLIKVRFQSRN